MIILSAVISGYTFQANAGLNPTHYAPPASIPVSCKDPVSAQAALSAWSSDYSQYQALPQGFGDAADAECGYSDGSMNNVIQVGSFQDSGNTCNGQVGQQGTFNCLSSAAFNSWQAKSEACLSNFYTNNASKYAPIDAQAKSVGQKITQDAKAFSTACGSTTRGRRPASMVQAQTSASDPCAQIPQLAAQFGKYSMLNPDLAATDKTALDAATSACDQEKLAAQPSSQTTTSASAVAKSSTQVSSFGSSGSSRSGFAR